MKKRSILCFFIVLCMVLLSSCQNKPASSDDSSSNKDSSAKKDPYNVVLSAEEFESIKSYINSIDPDIPVYVDFYSYDICKKDSDRLSQVGIKGVPVIISEIEENSNDPARRSYCYFLIQSVYAIWHVDVNTVRYWKNQSDEDFIEYNGYEKDCISAFYSYAKNEIEKIISCEQSVNLKIEQLRKFGLFAIDSVVQEIEKGYSEYKDFFTSIGMHLSISEYMNFMTDFDISWEDRHNKDGFSAGAEFFDYKVWLSENRTDLDNMFKFLDAYTKQ